MMPLNMLRQAFEYAKTKVSIDSRYYIGRLLVFKRNVYTIQYTVGRQLIANVGLIAKRQFKCLIHGCMYDLNNLTILQAKRCFICLNVG